MSRKPGTAAHSRRLAHAFRKMERITSMATGVMVRETICALRRAVRAIEERPAETLGGQGVTVRRFDAGSETAGRIETGLAAFDAALGGGLPLAALSELRTDETRQAGAATGFALALASLAADSARPLLWVAATDTLAEAGLPHAPGIAALVGLARFIVAPARTLAQALWVAEEAAACGAVGAVLVELRGNPARLDLTATRRLDRRAQASRRPVFLLRHAAEPEPTAAPVRLHVAAAPYARGDPLFPFGGAFAVTVEKSPAARQLSVLMEWNADERRFRDAAPHHGAVVSPPAGRSHPAPASRPGLAHRRSA